MTGMGLMMREAYRGYDEGKDRAQTDELRGLQIEGAKQGLRDAKYRSARQGIEDQRTDKEYERKETNMARRRAGQDAVRAFATTGNTETLLDFLNSNTRDGVTHYAVKNKEGTYDTIMEKDGKQIKDKQTKEDLLEYTFLVMSDDPHQEYVRQEGVKAAAESKKADRMHDIDKIDRKGMWDMKVAAAKEGGKGGLKGLEYDRKVANDLEARSKSRRGQMTGLGTIDISGINASLANYDGVVGAVLVGRGQDLNTAYSNAYNLVNSIHKEVAADAKTKYKDEDAQNQYVEAMLERKVHEKVMDLQLVRDKKHGLVKPGAKTSADAEGVGPASPADENPPVAGAKRGKDENGNPAWFVQKNGRWHKVEAR